MSTKTEAQIGILYQNGDIKSYSIETSLTSAQLKERVKNVNDSIGGGAIYTAPMKETFLSEEGSPMTKIGSVTRVVTTEEVVYNG